MHFLVTANTPEASADFILKVVKLWLNHRGLRESRR